MHRSLLSRSLLRAAAAAAGRGTGTTASSTRAASSVLCEVGRVVVGDGRQPGRCQSQNHMQRDQHYPPPHWQHRRPSSSAAAAAPTIPFKMTDIGEGIKEVELLQWFVRPGDAIRQFDRVCEVQSDKATVEITSRYDGTVVALHHDIGAMVPTGATLIDISTGGASSAAGGAATAAPAGAGDVTQLTSSVSTPPPPAAAALPPTAMPTFTAAEGGGLVGGGGCVVLASPAVRRRAREYGIDLRAAAPAMTATGPHGRLCKTDVDAYARAHGLARVGFDNGFASTPAATAAAAAVAADAASGATVAAAAAAAAPATPVPVLGVAPSVKVGWGRVEHTPPPAGTALPRRLNGLNGSARAAQARHQPHHAPTPAQAQAQAQREPRRAPSPEPAPIPRAASPAPAPHQRPATSDLPPAPRPDVHAAPAVAPATDQVIPLRGIQRAMAEHMKKALDVPHMGYCDEVVMDAMVQLRADLRATAAASAAAGAPAPPSVLSRLSYLPIILKATSLALRRHPTLNASVEGDAAALRVHADHNIGVAMDTPRGLVVPNIKRVQTLSIVEIAEELARLQAAGAAGKLTEADLAGGTFTLSNIGSVGGTYASPVLLVPQVGIGALGRVRTLPRYDARGAVVPQAILTVSWAGDHRVVDGATLARFSNTWKGLLENPALMIADAR